MAKRTRPPRRFTDATLLTAMETAGRTLDDRELAEAMKERGLGTPATRAEIIETLIRREYVERQGRSARGHREGDPPRGPRASGREEPGAHRRVGGAARANPERGRPTSPGFMRRIEDHVRALVGATLAGGMAARSATRSAETCLT